MLFKIYVLVFDVVPLLASCTILKRAVLRWVGVDTFEPMSIGSILLCVVVKFNWTQDVKGKKQLINTMGHMFDMQFMVLNVFVLLVLSLATLSTVTAKDGGEINTTLVASHPFDLGAHMPSHLAIMVSMSWFGIPKDDPQGPGPDPSYGNWYWVGPKCVQPPANPRICNEDLTPGSMQRAIASRRRPLAGIYSASARDWEGIARIKLMLANLRRPCDDGAKLDAWAVQIDSLRFTSRYFLSSLPFSSSQVFHYFRKHMFIVGGLIIAPCVQQDTLRTHSPYLRTSRTGPFSVS